MVFSPQEKNWADLDSLERLAVLVEVIPAHLCVFGRRNFSCPNVHFSRHPSFFAETGQVQTLEKFRDLAYLRGNQLSSRKCKFGRAKTGATGKRHRRAGTENDVEAPRKHYYTVSILTAIRSDITAAECVEKSKQLAVLFVSGI